MTLPDLRFANMPNHNNMKCKNCLTEFFNPYIQSKYCSKKCEDKLKKAKTEMPDEFKSIFWWLYK